MAVPKVLEYGILVLMSVISGLTLGGAQASEKKSQAELNYKFSKLPMCTHGLVLSGTITGDFKKAVIVFGGHETLFAIGQLSSNNLKIVEIRSHEVVILHDGVLEKLRITSGTGKDNTAYLQTRIADPKSLDQYMDISFENADSTAFLETPIRISKSTSDNKLDNNSLSNINRSTILGLNVDESDFQTQGKFTPGPAGGLIITETEQGGIYQRLGLEDGDNIRSVNGEIITTYLDLIQQTHNSKNGKELQVVIMRDGNYYNMTLSPKSGVEIRMVVDPSDLTF